MYVSNFIETFFYILFLFIFIYLIGNRAKSSIGKIFRKFYRILSVVSILGLIFGISKAFLIGNKFSLVFNDILKLFNFLVFIGLPYFVLANNNIFQKVSKIYNYFGFCYTFLVSISLFFAGNMNEDSQSVFPGHLFAASTINLTIVSAWLFYSFGLFILSKNKFYFLWSLLCYTNVFYSLAKWNLIALVVFPIIVFLMYNIDSKTRFSKRFFYVLTGVILLFFLININSLLTLVARFQGYDSFSEFTETRLLGSTESNGNLGKGYALGDSEIGIKDGARIVMWSDLFFRTIESPLFGIGLGSRALDYIGRDMEDHNIFITHFSRYGFPIFICWVVLFFKIISLLFYQLNIDGKFKKNIKYLILLIYLNFIFQSSVGNVWGQGVIVLFIGINIGLLVTKLRTVEVPKL